jgi:hypothetical protein
MDDFFRKEKTQESDIAEELKYELELEYDNFNQPAYKKGLYALAQLIHNLCFIVPGTYPTSPEMGINIKQYEFEILTDDELRRIQQHVQEQIDVYIPNSYISQVVCRTYTDPTSQLTNLGLGFALASDPSVIQNFFIFFSRNNGKVLSNILF